MSGDFATSRIPYDACPLCQSARFSELRQADCSSHASYDPAAGPIIRWMVCGACGHVFTDGVYTPEVLSRIFATTQDDQRPGHDFERHRATAARIVERVAAVAPCGRWLDVGFGNGALLFTAQEWGFEPIGIDLRADSVEMLRRLGVEAHHTEIANVVADGGVAVISLADVIEHTPYPREMIDHARRLLATDGAIFISTPNRGALAWRLLDDIGQNPYWGELEHYHIFSRESLNALMADAGFHPVSYGVSERYRLGMEIIYVRVS